MSSRSCIIKAPSKINLDLRVLRRQPDGFHELRTVFQTISLADIISIRWELSRRTELTLDGPDIPDNLILRAARDVLAAAGKTARVHFRLKKVIPMGAGLGGGSADAAAVLLALPAIGGFYLDSERLVAVAARLGSDVPFLLDGGTAIGFGRGTEVYPLADITEAPVLIVSSAIHVSTTEAYRALGERLTEETSSCKINDFQAFVRRLADAGRAEAGANDFETVVFSEYPQLKRIRSKLLSLGALSARMTGSGSAVYGIFGSAETRDRAVESFGGHPVFAARLVSRKSFRRLWRQQLMEHVTDDVNLWPPRSRYAR